MLTDLYVVLLTWLIGGIGTEMYFARLDQQNYRSAMAVAYARRRARLR